MTISYRIAQLYDISTLVENRIQFALELGGAQESNAIEILRLQMTNYFTKAIADNSCISIIAEHGNNTAGIGSVHFRELPGNFKNPTGKWGYIMNMYTLPAYRKNGICKTILNLLTEEGRKLGITAFELHATPQGEPIYLQQGFKKHIEPTLRKYLI